MQFWTFFLIFIYSWVPCASSTRERVSFSFYRDRDDSSVQSNIGWAGWRRGKCPQIHMPLCSDAIESWIPAMDFTLILSLLIGANNYKQNIFVFVLPSPKFKKINSFISFWKPRLGLLFRLSSAPLEIALRVF